jgi:hypothetical protein
LSGTLVVTTILVKKLFIRIIGKQPIMNGLFALGDPWLPYRQSNAVIRGGLWISRKSISRKLRAVRPKPISTAL